ncbi:MAG: hypothetical protein JO111_19290 [Caulobacteraceae bacterium]|nr:hypothetical protein [Caulobacteraceae bacterium]
MPEPSRTPWLIEAQFAATPIARLIEENAAVGLVCHACRHKARWPTAELRRRFAGKPKLTFAQVAPRLRCRDCRSEWVQITREVDRPP